MKYRLKYEYNKLGIGAIVYKLMKHDFGLARDDTNMTGMEHVSVTLNRDGDYPSFTIPVDYLSEVRERKQVSEMQPTFRDLWLKAHPTGAIIGVEEIERFGEMIVKQCAKKCVYTVDRQEILAEFGIEE